MCEKSKSTTFSYYKMLISSHCCEGFVPTEDIWIVKEKWKWNFESMLVFKKSTSVYSCQWRWKDVWFALSENSSEIKNKNVTCGHIWDGRHGRFAKNLTIEANLTTRARKSKQNCTEPVLQPLSMKAFPYPLHASDHHGVLQLDKVGLDHHLLLEWVGLDPHPVLPAGDHHDIIGHWTWSSPSSACRWSPMHSGGIFTWIFTFF